ncbi:DUF1275 domain-containing protein [Bacillus siamensis]|uniref:DUF1275 domain-containing protein n=1 Tax=Bacillus siamensis TaxID=659243 RepID=A0AAI8MYS0_9BACI|nr:MULTISPECIES: YoaK family protein [Bacillus]AME05182.1 hypothetical protein AUL54_01980 [Bacillus sp. SDLI1]AUJ77605.1 DUF1275 domain-containing protein [Bacillus siamensis]UUA85847.1 DUF1275 domain-containing protein [Bacillus siamensis]
MKWRRVNLYVGLSMRKDWITLTVTTYRNIALLLLCLTAGIVDVIGYLSLGHVFTANMTGNIVLFGMAIGNSWHLAVLKSLTSLIGFIAGVMAAAWLVGNKKKSFWPPAVTAALIIEGAVLLLFALFSCFFAESISVYVLIMLLSFAMGMQTTAARKLGVAGISTTVLTGTLANFFEDLTARFYKADKRKQFTRDAVLRALALVLYCFGAVIGAFAEPDYKFAVIWLPIIIILGIMLCAFTMFHGYSEEKNQ